MDKVELLERHYSAFINLTDQHSFFLGLFDYLNYADSEADFERVLAKLVAEQKKKEVFLGTIEAKAIEQLDKIRVEIEVYVNRAKIKSSLLTASFKEYSQWKDGLAKGNLPLSYNLRDVLCDVVKVLLETEEHKPFASHYVEFWPHDSSLIKDMVLPRELQQFNDALQELNEEKKSALWGQLNELVIPYQIIKSGLQTHKDLVKKFKEGDVKERNEAGFDLVFGHSPVYGAWKRIQDGQRTNNQIGDFLFNIKKVQPIATRLHNYILTSFASTKPGDTTQNGLHFDDNKSFLIVDGKLIKFRKFSHQFDVLRVIFENPKDLYKEWFYSEIGELIDSSFTDERRYYNAINQIKIKFEKLGIRNRIITTLQSFKIEP